MNRSIRFRRALLLSCLVGMGPGLALCTGPIRAAGGDSPAGAIDLFQARDDGKLVVKFVATDEKQGKLQLRNPTADPIVVDIPDAMAGVPVLAQFGPNNNFNAFPNNNANNPPQRIGIGGAGLNRGQPLAALGPQPGGRLAASDGPLPAAADSVVTVLPHRMITVSTRGVCLNYGDPTPTPQMAYDVVPIAKISDDPRLAIVVRALGQRRYDQQVVQAEAWHVANNKSWDDLAVLPGPPGIEHLFGRRQLQLAQRLDRAVNSPTLPTPISPGASVSQSPAPSQLDLSAADTQLAR